VARGATRQYLEAMGHAVQVAADAATALGAAAQTPPEVLICDCNLAQPFDGLDVARRIHADSGASVILVTGHPPDSLQAKLGDLEVAACLRKPLSLKDLAATVAAL